MDNSYQDKKERIFRTIEYTLLKENKRKIQVPVPQSDVRHFFRTIRKGGFGDDVADGEGEGDLKKEKC